MNGDVCSLIFAIVFVPSMIMGWMLVLERLRVRRVRRAYSQLSVKARDLILDQIDQAGRDRSGCSVLVADIPNSTDVAASHYGGLPYAEVGDIWPEQTPGEPGPADFMIQVRLDDTFPEPWVGRLIVVFNRFDYEQTVRCYATPAVDRMVAMTGGPEPQKEWGLIRVRVPKQEDSESGEPTSKGGLLDYDPVVLLETIPELSASLKAVTPKPADLLAAILAPNHCSYGFELSDIVQVAGEPVWLQEDPGAQACPECGASMRFLFQFGDLNGGVAYGDAGVCYLFGCDAHPDRPFGFAQML